MEQSQIARSLKIAELVDEVNRRLRAEKIRPTDPRAKAKVTARTVHHYLDKGLLPAARRVGSQLRFSDAHINALMNIKRRQAEGLTLDEIESPTDEPSPLKSNVLQQWNFITDSLPTADWGTKYSRLSANLQSLTANNSIALSTTTFRWHVALGNGMELSGEGKPPDRSTIDSIRQTLNKRPSDPEEDTQ